MRLSDFSKKLIIQRSTNVEGGYVFDPNDLGGETNWGITAALANEYKAELTKRFSWNGSMKSLTQEMAFWLYDVEFYQKIKGDDLFRIHPLLADKVFDIAINTGKTRAGTMVQEFLNVNNNEQKLYKDILKVDGWIGPITLTAFEGFIKARGTDGIRRMLHTLIALQTAHYINISLGREKNERFTYGWLNRSYQSAVEYQKLGFLYI